MDQLLNRPAHFPLPEDEIGHGNSMMGINISCQRRQGAIRHPDDNRGHVLEGIGH
jgi:hypothetical protein